MVRRSAGDWFRDSMDTYETVNIVFADPDNGLRKREEFKPGQRKSGKSICEDRSALLAANGRPLWSTTTMQCFQGAIARQSGIGKGAGGAGPVRFGGGEYPPEAFSS